MKIYLDDNTKMNTALSLAERGRYADALLLFAQVDTYESLLNQVACLCGMEEDGFATDLYRQVKQQFGFTHAVYADALTFGEVMSTVLDFCESDRDYARKQDGALRANPDLLAKVSYDYESDLYDEEPTGSFFSTPLLEPTHTFYDVTDPKYIHSLRAEFEDAMMDGDERAVKDLYKTALAFDRSDAETLELQLALITVRQKFKGKTPLAIAKKYADCDVANVMATGAALEIILHNSPYKNLDTLNKLVKKLVPDAEYIAAGELAELVFLATDVLNDAETAYLFAKVLYTKRDELTLDDYKLCATAFFNHGDRALAKDAIVTLHRYVPRDPYVTFWLEFVDRAPQRETLLQVGEKTVRHFFVPYAFMNYVNSAIGQKLLGDTLELTADDFRLLTVLFAYVKSLLIMGENNKYQEVCAYVRAMLHTVPPADKEDFFAFAEFNLMTMVNDHLLNQTLIARLVELGYDRRVFVGLADTYQVVDFSQLQVAASVTLGMALGIALSVARADVALLVTAYDKLKPLVECEEFSLSLAHNLAYALLCVVNSDFPKTESSEFFTDSEKELYQRYLKSNL